MTRAVPQTVEFRPIDDTSARAILRWSYEPPLNSYNADDADQRALETLLEIEQRYFGAFSDGDLVGFCCFGADARVPGGDYLEQALDVGARFRPDLFGRRIGCAFLDAVMTFADEVVAGQPLRATIAAFNGRTLRIVAACGFDEAARFRRADGVGFVVLVRRRRRHDSGRS